MITSFFQQGIPLVKFRQQILSGHNIKRLLHGVPPLTEDQKLDGEAQSFAAKLASQGSLTHSPLKDRLGKGENIALRCSFGGIVLSWAVWALSGGCIIKA